MVRTTFTPARIAQLVRFCLVGLTIFILNIALMAVLHELLGVHYVAAFVLVFIIGNVLGYWLNKRFTFALNAQLDRATLARYLLVNVVALVVGAAALHVLIEWLHVWWLAAFVIVAGGLAPMSFLVHRFVTYRVTT